MVPVLLYGTGLKGQWGEPRVAASGPMYYRSGNIKDEDWWTATVTALITLGSREGGKEGTREGGRKEGNL